MPKIKDLTIEELRDKIINNKSSFASMIKAIDKDIEILNKINSIVSFDFNNASLLEKLYAIKLNLDEYPKCIRCESKCKFESKQWSKYCDKNCGYLDMWLNMNETDLNKRRAKISEQYRSKSHDEKQQIKEHRKQKFIDKYGVDHNFKIQDVIDNRRQKWIEKYGYDRPSKSEIVKNKMIETNIERYGHNSPLLDQNIKKKAEETLYKNYKVTSPLKSKIIKDRWKDSCYKKYGSYHHMQDSETYDRISKKSFKWYTIEINGTIHKVQGYEGIAIEYLINNGHENSTFITNSKEISNITGPIYWKDENKNKRYYPDFYISETKTLYEIKSEYTYKKSKESGVLDKKIKACIEAGLKIKVLVFNKNHKLINEL